MTIPLIKSAALDYAAKGIRIKRCGDRKRRALVTPSR
jgi:hypothetical protein